MANRIKGITVEIGGDTTKLQTALKGVNGQIKNTQFALKDVEKLLKLDPTNTTLLAQKQKLLAQEIGETKEKLATLKTAAEQANKQLQKGEISQEQYDALQCEIAETEGELKRLESQASKTNQTLTKIGEVGSKVESFGNVAIAEKQKELLIAHAKTEGVKQRIDELLAFIHECPKELTKYDESMVRKYIEQIKVYEWKFTVCFKAKVENEISR